jgi:hypothetical protein
MAKRKKLSLKQLEGRRRYYEQAWHHRSPPSELEQSHSAPGAQRVIQSCMLASLVCVMAWYAIAAVVHSSASIFLFEGFMAVDGVAAIAYGISILLLAAGYALHVHERHWSSYKADQYRELRRTAYWTAAVFFGLAILVFLLSFKELPELQRVAIAPQASWPLWPTAASWRVFLFFSQTHLFHTILISGAVSFAVALLCMKLTWIRLGFVGYAAGSLSIAAYFLGDASYQYAVTRKLAQLQNPDFMAHYLQQPAQANAWISVCQSLGWGALAIGLLFLWSAWGYSKSEIALAAARVQAT